MGMISATMGFVALVDDEDEARFSCWRWRAHQGRGQTPRPARSEVVNGKRRIVFLHRAIMNCPEGRVVDHVNGDPWDNRRSNLRICDRVDNAKNRKTNAGTKSGLKGVHPVGDRYHARIWGDCKKYNLGSYVTAEEAGLAYDAAAKFLHGQFARVNFPDRDTAPESPDDVLARTAKGPSLGLQKALARVAARNSSHRFITQDGRAG